MPGARIVWIVTMKFRPVRIDEKPVMKTPIAAGITVRVRVHGAERRVEGPAGVDAAGRSRIQSERAADHVDVPAQQVELGKARSLRADHQRDQEVAEHRGDRRDQEEEDHHHAVHREQLVVGLGLNQVALRRHQLEPHQRRRRAADEEEERDRDHVQQRDPLVVGRQQPRLQP